MKTIKNSTFAISLICLSISSAYADVVTDGSMGAVQTLSGNNITVFESLGTRTGDNLFHSFSTFSIASGQTVNFTGAAEIQNVISRVSGGEISTINGVLSSTVGNANFFFLNPNGIVIGSDAQINVPAAVYFSTAETLIFADDTTFSTDASASPSLTIESPASFGFLGAQGDVSLSGAVLDQSSGSSLHISAGNIDVSDSMVTIIDGHIEFSALGGAAEELAPFVDGMASSSGQIALDNSLLSTPGVNTGGGKIQLNSHQVFLNDSLLEINTTGETSAAQNSGVYVDTFDFSITDSGNALGIATYTGIDQLTATSGNAADININASGVISLNGDANIITAAYSGTGNAGDISIQGGSIVIDGDPAALFPAGIYAYADGASSGAAGAINIDLSGDLSVGQNSTIDGSTYGMGDAASISIVTDGVVSIVDGGTLLSNTYGAGAAGDINIDSSSLSVTGTGSALASESAQFLFETSPGNFVVLAEARGNAGTISVNTSNAVTINNGAKVSAASLAMGEAGQVSLNSSSLDIDRSGAAEFTGVTVEAANANSGAAGNINISVSGAVDLFAGASIIASSRSAEQAGAITISAGSMLLDHQASGDNLETAITSQGISTADGGDINVDVAGNISLIDGAQIDTTTFGSGAAGDVLVTAGSITLDGKNNSSGTGIGSQTQGSGQGGNVSVVVDGALTISDGAQITTDAFSSGNGGNVTVAAGSIAIDGAMSFETTGITSLTEWDSRVGNDVADSTGHAGNVQVASSGAITLSNVGQISSSAQNGSTGNGGNVSVTSQSLDVNSYAKVAAEVRNTSGLVGRAGDVSLDVSGDIALDAGRITVASTTFQGGTEDATAGQGVINISAGDLSLNNFSSITAQSTSDIASSNVNLNVASLKMQDSEITTTAFNADGGDVAVNSQQLIVLKDALLTTSVFGTGNGGDITIDAPIMLMDNGFIQANTAGVGSSGGDINMQADAVVPNTGNVLVGGSERYSFNYGSETYGEQLPQNVIQAAAPDGINGAVNINAPEVDLSAELTIVETTVLSLNDMVWDPCAAGAKGTISNQGKGGMRSTPDLPGIASVVASAGRFAFDNDQASKEMVAFQFESSQGGCAK